MGNDSFTETTSTSWFGRIGGAFKGVVVGIVLILISFPILFFNEGRAVKTQKTLDEGQSTFISISTDEVRAENDGKLVYLSGKARTPDGLLDPDFGVASKGLRLKREVEMFQWKETKRSETKKKLGGGEETVTTYDYAKIWENGQIDSSQFKKQAGHSNPEMAVKSQEWAAEPIHVGSFSLSPDLSQKINNFTAVTFDSEKEFSGEYLGKTVTVSGGTIYLGKNPESPELGDLRIRFEEALPGDVSIIAQQKGTSFVPFIGKAGGRIQMLETGVRSAESMFVQAQKSNTITTWILRVVGLVVMFIGFSAILRPLSVMADVVPFIGNIVGVGTGLVALLLSAPISLLIISIAWIFYRPLIGIPLIVVAAGGFGLLIWKLISQKKGRETHLA